MTKKSIKQLKKFIKLKERLVGLESPDSKKDTVSELTGMISKLISVDSMLCQSESLATHQYADDAAQLLNIIQKHHVGLEVLLSNNGVVITRSEPGTEFNPEYMQAHPQLINTDDSSLHGKVACSVTPLFEQKDVNGRQNVILQYECVMLYNFKKEV